jgi:hypothetical protein
MERDESAYDALTGEPKARAKLTKLNRELAEVELEMASFDAAIREAEKRVINTWEPTFGLTLGFYRIPTLQQPQAIVLDFDASSAPRG